MSRLGVQVALTPMVDFVSEPINLVSYFKQWDLSNVKDIRLKLKKSSKVLISLKMATILESLNRDSLQGYIRFCF